MNKTLSSVAAPQVATVALIALLAGAAAIAFAPIFVRLSAVGPVATAFWRMAFAIPVFWLWILPQSHAASPRPVTLQDYRWLALAGFFFAGDLFCWHWALEFTTVANSTILANCAPIFVTLAAWLFFHERVTKIFLTGLVIALTGAVMLVGAGFSLSSQTWFGDLLGIITAIFYAGYILSIKQARAQFATGTIMAWSGTVACLLLLPAALSFGETLIAPTWQGWAILIGIALICQVGGQGLIAYALAHLPAPFSSVTLLLQPVLATIFAWLILTETIGFWQAVGGLIVLGGIFLARQGSVRS